jgi:acetamidase/formamidase
MKTHEIMANPQTVHWGYFSYGLAPVLKVASGDRVVIRTLSGNPGHLPKETSRYPQELVAIHKEVRKGIGPHLLVGPIEITGAEPGDVLEVKIEEINLWLDWSYNLTPPLTGSLPEEFPHLPIRLIDLDLKTGMAEVVKGRKVRLKPFFGVLGVSPPRKLGEIPSNPPYVHGGNLDNKELVGGSILYLPIWKKGAGFSVGDGHAVQGDGEVNQTALETALIGKFRLKVRKDMKLKWPRAETSTHYMTMGFNRDLDEAAKLALKEMIAFLCEKHKFKPADAYVFCSAAVDLRITQLVNGNKGVHAMVEKALLA